MMKFKISTRYSNMKEYFEMKIFYFNDLKKKLNLNFELKDITKPNVDFFQYGFAEIWIPYDVENYKNVEQFILYLTKKIF